MAPLVEDASIVLGNMTTHEFEFRFLIARAIREGDRKLARSLREYAVMYGYSVEDLVDGSDAPAGANGAGTTLGVHLHRVAHVA
jgi:hypothetical protein